MSTEDLSAERAADELHSAIMNLPCKPYDGTTSYDAYCRGHRDARYAAAELVHARASSAAAVPAGWKLVPVEPTKEMSDAAYKAHGYPGGNAWAYQAAYRTMLAATPAPPQADHFPDAGKMVPPQAVPATDAKAVATVTECEACFTPDACQLRGTCDHYAAERLRVAPAAPVAVDAAPELPPLPDSRCRASFCVGYTNIQMIDYARAALRAAGAGSRDKEDAERYRWLRDNGRCNNFSVEQQSRGWTHTHSAASLDTAIDAARGKA